MYADTLISQLADYAPFNEQETSDKNLIIHMLKNIPNIFYRDNEFAHMTASAWITNHSHTKILMAYHNIYNSWAWLGGHADGETDLCRVAVREAIEETGLTPLKVYNDIFSLESLTVNGHIKRGNYISSHLHLNITYLIEADETAYIRPKFDENTAVSWFSLEDSIQKSTEPWIRENIYKKLNKKLSIL